MIFLGRRTNNYIVGLPPEESETLLGELWTLSTKPDFSYRHKWKVGQVVACDNRVLLHMRHPVDESLDRLIWRTQTKCEAVIPALK